MVNDKYRTDREFLYLKLLVCAVSLWQVYENATL